MRIEQSITINQPIEQVFQVVSTPSTYPQWGKDMSQAEQTSGGPMGQGATFRYVSNLRGNDVEMNCEVTQYQPPRAFTYQTVSGMISSTLSFILEPVAGGTKVNLILDAEPGGPMKLAGPLMSRTMKKTASESLDNLKRWLRG